METAELLGLMVPVTFFAMFAIERIFPAREFPPRRGWAWIGIGFLIFGGVLATVVPLLISPEWLQAHRWIDGSTLGPVLGAIVGYAVLSAVNGGWHWLMHHWSWLWRLTHQLHHSPQRVDMPGALFFHPLDSLGFLLIQLFVTLIVLGLDPLAAAITGYIAAFYGMFQHWNVRTPQWLGYFIQRPESHGEHHRKGVHAYNYSDLPIWDILLGSFKNPKTFDGACGFEAPADKRLGAMLAFTDVNAPLYGDGSRGAKAMPPASAP